MNSSVHVHRFHATHRVADDVGRRCALAAQQRLLDGELEAALAQLAPADELVLLRRLQLQVTLDAGASDGDNARRWSLSLVQGLVRELQHAGPDRLLRFTHRHQALQAFVHDMLQGRTARDWAWQRLGLLPRAGAAAASAAAPSAAVRHAALLRLLADDAERGVPLLRGLLATPDWPPFVRSLADGELRGLTLAVATRLAGAGVPVWAGTAAAGTGAIQATPHALERPASGQPGSPAPDGVATAQPHWWAPTVQAAGTEHRAAWALRLACLLSAPALARRGAAAVDTCLQAWTQADAQVTAPVMSAAGQGAVAAVSPQPGAAAVRTIPRRPVPDREGAESPRTDATAQGDIRQAAALTEHGGLLLLVPLLPSCGALRVLEDAAVWPPGLLPQAMHSLALSLGPLRPQDAAALAFCGLPPQAAPPPPLQPTPAQTDALLAAKDLLQAQLAQRLPQWPASQRLARVLHRRARIEALPGWIDVHFALADVSLDLRRAALDLDPGFIPWLGLVLRYVYE
ncbi:MAG: hypothetical protein Q7U73_16220 [Rubrivivax sp.]|nr:hypothetical protein [Rubrivivax sp.]